MTTRPSFSRRKLVAISLAVSSLLALPGHSVAQSAGNSYPDRPVKMVVPYAAGAAADQLGRLLAERMGQSLGQPLIVDNRGGAGGTLGADITAKSPADGYTIVLGTEASQATNMFLSKKFPYDPVKSFTPIGPVAINHIVLVVHPALPVKSVGDLVAYAKANPKEISYGSSGSGSGHHLAGAMLNEKAGITMQHIPYRGGAPAMTDLLGGTLQVLFASMATAKPYIESGKVRALGVVEAQRFAGLPDVPTVGETVPGYAITSWFAMLGPAGLPQPVVARLNASLNDALRHPALRETLQKSGMTATGGSAAELATQIASELPTRAKLVQSAGIVPE